MTQTRLNVSFLWFFYFRQERRIDCYAENEQEAETRMGVVKETALPTKDFAENAGMTVSRVFVVL